MVVREIFFSFWNDGDKKATGTKHLKFWSWILNIGTHYVQNIA
jgi:hypothetical protein